jgi:cyclase
VTVGGRLQSREDVAACFAVGADKVLMKSAFFDAPALCEDVAATYGSQALIAGIDVSDIAENQTDVPQRTFIARGRLKDHVRGVVSAGAGEVLIQSVERDGTGNGLDLSLAALAQSGSTPLILMGGIGQASHLCEGLKDDAVDAVATANLFNFIGDALVTSRLGARMDGVPLADWSPTGLEGLRGVLQHAGSDYTGEEQHRG